MTIHAPIFPALEFTISLASDGSYHVREEQGRGGAQFADLSDAILFVKDECRAQKYRPTVHFDRSLACIRAAG